MMRCLVTGATGYIGGRLSAFLSERGYQVRCGSRRAIHDRGNFAWVATDFDSKDSLAEACRNTDVIVHLAALNEIESAADPERSTLVNTINTQRLVAAARASDVPRFVYFSTVHVYGSPLKGEINEETCATPVHPYAISHKAAEDYLRYAASTSEIKCQIVRLTNSFGYPVWKDVDRWSLVVNDACRQLALTGKVALRTPGSQLRDFVTLTDVCRAVEVLLEKAVSSTGVDTYNVGGESTMSVRQMVERVVRVYEDSTGRSAPIDAPKASSSIGIDALRIDISRLRAAGFVPLNNIDEEIRELLSRCLAWFSA